jgi:hypothetical protein
VFGRRFVVRPGKRYYGGIISRVDTVELSALAQQVEAGIAPEDARNDRYSCDTAVVSCKLTQLRSRRSPQIGKVVQKDTLDHRILSWWRGFEWCVVSFGRGIVQEPQGCLIAFRHLGCISHVQWQRLQRFVVVQLFRKLSTRIVM